VLIRIEGFDLPGRTCGPGPDFPEGHHNIHVAVQGRKGQQDLYGLLAGDAPSARWDLSCEIVPRAAMADLRGPHIQGTPGARFVYLTWGVVEAPGAFTMFRRAKLWLNAVPPDVLAAAIEGGLLLGRLRLTDAHGGPLCASVRPPAIAWSAE
jgi:hypothetical protein